MTHDESLAKSRKLWEYLAQTGVSKKAAYSILDLSPDKNDCPLCEYAFKAWNHRHDDWCDNCPAIVEWNKFKPDDPPWIKEPTPCEQNTLIPWVRWSFAGDVAERKIAAADMCTLLNGIGENL